MQKHSSKFTSINSVNLPTVYTHVDWKSLLEHCKRQNPTHTSPVILDYGCGRYTDHIKDYVTKRGFTYIGYDPNWTSSKPSDLPHLPDVVICSNVLNVIDDEWTRNSIKHLIHTFNCPYFITVYEGDKSGIGRASKEDCWQENRVTKTYADEWDTVRYKVIVNKMYKQFVIRGEGQ